MAQKNNKKCLNCGKVYSYCPTCPRDLGKPAWMNAFCSKNCMDLFETATSYLAGSITKDQAAKVVNNAELSNITKFDRGVIKMVNDIQESKEEKIVKKNKVEKSVDISKSTNDIKKSVKKTFEKEEKKEEKIVDKTKNKKKSSKSQVKMTSLWGSKDDK